MGQYVIKMPDIGEGIAEVELVKWYVKPGDMVSEEQILADVTTDKANVEIPSHVAGKVVALNGSSEPGSIPKPAAPPPAPEPQRPAPPPPPENTDDRPTASPAVRRRAKELGIDLAEIEGSGPDGRVTQQDLE